MISDNMITQGRQMSVRGFTTRDSLDQVIKFYRDLWRKPPTKRAPAVAYDAETLAPWHLLTRVEDGYVMTVQIQPTNDKGTFGYLALGKLPDPGEGPLQLPMPPSMDGSVVLSNVQHDDPGKRAQTSMLTNTYSVSSNLNFYRDKYSDWRKDIDQAMGHNSIYALAFRRGPEEVVITIKGGADGSRIVVNSVRNELF
ncbi:MAG: hypothetical protein ACPHUF_17030 [Gammaproteobacteria bacterium]